jgi:hypothetical protein
LFTDADTGQIYIGHLNFAKIDDDREQFDNTGRPRTVP